MGHITIKDIARQAGVSCATVSRVLNASSQVNAQTREAVLAICDREGFRPNQLARSLSASRTGLLGLILPEIDNPFFFELSLSLESYARDLGYSIMLCTGRPEDKNIDSLIEFFMSRRLDGVILASSSNEAQPLIHKYNRQIPMLLLGDCADNDIGLPINLVGVDNAMGGRMAAEYLHHQGHRQVLYCGLRPGSITHQLRWRGFQTAASQLGMMVRVLENGLSSSSTEAGFHLAQEFFSKPFSETAAFAAADSVALGVMQAADANGISIPQRLSLLGFDNISYAALPKIRLSTIDQAKKQQAVSAVDLLLQMIAQPDRRECTRQLIQPELVERDSCRRLDFRP